jgi:integration host factor subunit beta
MIRSELIARLRAHHPHLQHREIERAVSVVLDTILKTLAEGGRVELRGFGTFSVKLRLSRMGRNPRTGALVPVSQKRAPYFRTGRELRVKLNAPLDQPSSSGSSATPALMSAP